MMKLLKFAPLATLLWASAAFGQQNVLLNYQGSNGQPVQASAANPLPVTGGGGGGGGGAVYGPTAAGSPAANPPVIIGGTVDGTPTGAVDNLKVVSGIGYVNCANCSGSGSVGSDGSTSIATGGTAQNLFSGATPTNGWEVCNPNASDDMWISQSTTSAINGQGSMRIAANGGCVSSPRGMSPFHAISIIGPTTGDKITAVQW
jgi:hypothetical protein